MNTALSAVYNRLPAWSRSVAATAWGAYLHAWRYGSETDRLAEEAIERESWSPAQWQSWQQERLAFVLDRAARHVPYYREIWQARRRGGDRRSWEYLENWPLLEKEALRRNPRAFLAADCSRTPLFHEQTSGTTGTPIHVWRTRHGLRARYALYEARRRQWYGVSRFDRWAILGGQPVAPVSLRRPPFWVWNAALRQLYLSSHHVAPEFAPYYCSALAQYKIRYLWGYSSSLHSLAYQVLRQRLTVGGIKVVITNAEPLSSAQRQTISAAFQCPVRETYGMVEFVAAAGECEHGSLHSWPEAGAIENGGNGEFVCTGLQNLAMPLIRYRVGDSGSIPTWDHACRCGRRLPIIRSLHGRISDVVVAPDGRRVFWLNPVFYGQPVREAQIVQEASGSLHVRYVRDAGFTSATAQTIIRRLRDRLGPIEVDLLPVNHIPRGANGKFQPVISHVPLPEQPASERLHSF